MNVLRLLFVLAWMAVMTVPAWANAGAVGQGVVKKVDDRARTLTIEHGPIRALNMSAMTMDFYVADPAMLEEVRPGDKIQFEVEMDRRGRYVIVDLELE